MASGAGSLQTGLMRLLPIVFAFAVGAVIVSRWRRLGWPVGLAGVRARSLRLRSSPPILVGPGPAVAV